jgi:hypothetical protein
MADTTHLPSVRSLIDSIESDPGIQSILMNPAKMTQLQGSADNLRRVFPDVGDEDLGWMSAMFMDMLSRSAHGGEPVVSVLSTMALLAREFLMLYREPAAA